MHYPSSQVAISKQHLVVSQKQQSPTTPAPKHEVKFSNQTSKSKKKCKNGSHKQNNNEKMSKKSTPKKDKKEKQQQQTTAETAQDFENFCAICHNQLPTKKSDHALTNCNHKFCYECINPWVSNYKSECPSCRSAVTILKRFLEDGSSFDENIAEPAKETFYVDNLLNSTQDAYACLGHDYFLQEISTLLRSVSRIQESLKPFIAAARSSFRFVDKKKNSYELQYIESQDVKNALLSLDDELRLKLAFDPVTVLETLYALQDRLRMMHSAGEFNATNPIHGNHYVRDEAITQKGFENDEEEEEYYDDQEEYFNETEEEYLK